MPANLTPEYKAAEQEYRQAREPEQKLACLERMLSLIPKHKGTEKMQADLKRRIARLRDSLQKRGGRRGFAIKVEPEGAAQVVLVGPPNSGKSTLLECTTNARAEVGDHPFTTRLPTPGMLVFENLQFQLVDLPPLDEEQTQPWVYDVIRRADSALLVVDAAAPDCVESVERVLRLLAAKKIELVGGMRAERGGQPVRRVPTVVLANKMDVEGARSGAEKLERRFEPDILVLPMSAFEEDFASLGRAIFDSNRLIRVYSKSPGKEPDLDRPFVMRRGQTLMDFANLVHKDFAEKLKYARVWGVGKFDGQRIQRDQALEDGDVVELHT